VRAKKDDESYFRDNNKMSKRFLTGVLGEVAVEELIHKQFVNWTVGAAKFYNKADLTKLNLNIGIKTVEMGKLPVIHKKPKRPEIINLKVNDHFFYICGLATRETLLKYQDDDGILSPALRKKGNKTAFYGFSELIKFNNFAGLVKAYYTDLFISKIAI
jgi:hypothetical protein